MGFEEVDANFIHAAPLDEKVLCPSCPSERRSPLYLREQSFRLPGLSRDYLCQGAQSSYVLVTVETFIGLTICQARPLALVRTLPPEDLPIPEDPLSPIWRKVAIEYIEWLSASVKLRVQDIPRLSGYGPTFSSNDIFILSALFRESLNSPKIAILFSGGIDCTLIAYLSHLSVAELINPRKDILNQVLQTSSNHRANRPFERGF